MKKLFATVAIAMSAVTLFSGYGGCVDPRSWSLPSLACLAYPAVLAVAVAVAVLLLAFRQWRSALVVGLAVVATWPTLRLTVPVHVGSRAAEGQRTFTLMTYNVSGFGYGTDDRVMRYILDCDCDIVVLQEGSLGPTSYDEQDRHSALRERLDRTYPYRSHGYHDLMLMSKYPYTVFADTTLRHGFGALDDINSEYHFYAKLFDVDLGGTTLRLVNVHLQSIGLDNDDKQLYESLTRNPGQARGKAGDIRHSLLSKVASAFRRRAPEAELVRGILDDMPADVPLVLCGDFNDTPQSFTYRTIVGDDLHDAYGERGKGYGHTFNANRLYFRIDHVLYRGPLRLLDIRRDIVSGSDHFPQVARFELRQPS